MEELKEGRTVDLNNLHFDLTSEKDLHEQLGMEEKDLDTLSGKVDDTIKELFDAPGNTFDSNEAILKVLGKLDGRELLYFALAGIDGCIENHLEDNEEQYKAAQHELFHKLPAEAKAIYRFAKMTGTEVHIEESQLGAPGDRN